MKLINTEDHIKGILFNTLKIAAQIEEINLRLNHHETLERERRVSEREVSIKRQAEALAAKMSAIQRCYCELVWLKPQIEGLSNAAKGAMDRALEDLHFAVKGEQQN